MIWLPRAIRSPEGRRFRLLVAAACLSGLVAATTAAAVTSRSTVAPASSSPPTISGAPAVGGTLTANPGTWSGSTPISFQYQWRICDGNGGACRDLAGATASTYKPKEGDIGSTLRIRVIAANGDGSASATSVPTARIVTATAAPVNTEPPTISGDQVVGGTVKADPGKWSGATPITFGYQWIVCDGNGGACHDASGATSQSFQPVTGHFGNTLRVRVTAQNPGGTTSVTSVPTAKIAAAPGTPAVSGCPKPAEGAQSVAVADVVSPARLQVDRFQLVAGRLNARLRSFSIRVHVSDTCGQSVNGANVYVTAVPYNQVTIPRELPTDGNGWATLAFDRLSGFPAAREQRLMVMFVRARKPGESLLAGVSTRRLISLPVYLRG
jgi:hypothetical protein